MKLAAIVENGLEAYVAITQTVVPGPLSLSWFVAVFALPTALLIPPSILSHRQLATIFLPIIFASVFHAWSQIGGLEVITADCLWWSLFLLGFNDVRHDFKRVCEVREDKTSNSRLKTGQQQIYDSQAAGSVEITQTPSNGGVLPLLVDESYPDILSERLVWVVSLVISRPLSSWKIGRPSHDKALPFPWPSPTRRLFLTTVSLRLGFVIFLIMPLAIQLYRSDDYFRGPSTSLFSSYSSNTPSSSTALLLQSIIPMPVLRSAALAMYMYGLLNIMFLAPALLAVISNGCVGFPKDAWSPHTFAPHFGPFVQGVLDKGIRGFWGIFWHQQMRHMVAEPGKYLADRLHLRSHSLSRYALQCIFAFGLSGITHMGLVPPHPRWSSVEAQTLRLRVATFFWLQPIGILAEIVVVERVLDYLLPSSRKVELRGRHTYWPSLSKHLKRALRFAWVLFWTSVVCPVLVEPFRELGYWSIWPPPFVPQGLGAILAGEWLP